MNAQPDLFIDVVAIFVAAFAGGLGARALRLPALLGYLVVGIAIGPHALGFIGNVDDVQTIAGFGVVLLLFAVGVEISMVDLARVGRRVLLAGGGQIVGTLAAGYAIGLALGWDAGQAIVFGMVLSLSSTMVVMKTLADRGAVGTLNGRITTGILLLQDLAFIPMVAVLPALAGRRILRQLLHGARVPARVHEQVVAVLISSAQEQLFVQARRGHRGGLIFCPSSVARCPLLGSLLQLEKTTDHRQRTTYSYRNALTGLAVAMV